MTLSIPKYSEQSSQRVPFFTVFSVTRLGIEPTIYTLLQEVPQLYIVIINSDLCENYVITCVNSH